MPESIDYAGAVKRGWWIVLLLIVIAIATSAILTAQQREVFQSSAMLVVAPTSDTNEPGEIIKTLETLERRTVIATFARIPSTPEVRQTIATEFKLPSAGRGYRINGSVVPNTNILRIDVEGPDRAMVASVANRAAEVTAREARSLYRVYTMRMLAKAEAPSRPSYPDPRRNYLVAAVAGTFLGLAAMLVVERLRSRRNSSEVV